jgi:ABC-type Fe3+-hydroxamate transport system substrate-binding protein
MSGPGVQDDTGAMVPIPARVSRVVSLVPSLTETVAVTAPGPVAGADWHPSGRADVPGPRHQEPGPRGGHRARPDVVLANEEENWPVDLAAPRRGPAGLGP